MLSALPLKQLLSALPVPLLRGELAVNIPGMVLVAALCTLENTQTTCAASASCCWL